MNTLKITPISEIVNMLPPKAWISKEAQAPGIVHQWRQQLQSGRNARTGQLLTDRQRREIQSKLDTYNASNPAPAAPAASAAPEITLPSANTPSVPAAPINVPPVQIEEQPQQNPDMKSQIQELVNQRDAINRQIQEIQQMFGTGQPQGAAPAQPAQQMQPQGPQGFGFPLQQNMPADRSGIVDRVRNWWNERELGKEQNRGYRQQLQQQRENLQRQRLQPQQAYNERPILTASMGSASSLFE